MNELPFCTIDNVKDVRGKRVLLRASLDVPVHDNRVTNDFRIRTSFETIDFLVKEGARVIVISHRGRDPKETFTPLFPYFRDRYACHFAQELVSNETKKMVSELAEGDVLLLPNLRTTTKEAENDAEFARDLSTYGDIYVNDAFSVSHRAHASIVGIPFFLPSYAGLNFAQEFIAQRSMFTPQAPSLFILGGAKFETKEPLVHSFSTLYDTVFVGGALAHDFFLCLGYEIGDSLRSESGIRDASLIARKNILLPRDVIVVGPRGRRVSSANGVQKNERILDAGPGTLAELEERIKHARTILWNGPLGDYEHGFAEGTEYCASLIAESRAFSLVGGGDTIASIERLGLNDKFGFMSTAGGAMLVFLETKTLPGIDALSKAQKRLG